MTIHHPTFFGGRICTVRCACGWQSQDHIRGSLAWGEHNRHETVEGYLDEVYVEPTLELESGFSQWEDQEFGFVTLYKNEANGLDFGIEELKTGRISWINRADAETLHSLLGSALRHDKREL